MNRKTTSYLYTVRLLDALRLLAAFVAVVLFAPSGGWAAVAFPPSLNNINDQVSFLRFIQTHIPRLFEEGAEYDVDFFALLTQQQALVTKLEAAPVYMSAAEQKAALKRVRIDVHQPQAAVERRPKPATLKDWQEAYNRSATSADKNRAEIVKLIRSLSARDPRGMLTGLIHCMPKDAKGALFSKTPEEQLAALEKEKQLTDQAILANYKGLPEIPKGRSVREFMLDSIGKSLDQEEELVYRLALARALEATPPSPAHTLFARAAEHLDISEALGDFEAAAKEADSARGPSYLKKVVQQSAKSLYAMQATTRDAVVESVELVEVPPYIGIFRGFAGGDCSTQFSFSFPYAPAESTYFVYDMRGELKGYAMTTDIQVGGKPALYIHDVAGPRLSPRMVELVIQGLAKMARQSGVPQAVMPNSNRIFQNSNYADQRQMQQDMIANLPLSNIEYLDTAARTEVAVVPGANINQNYDMPRQNAQGHVIGVNAVLDPTIHLKVETMAPPKPELKPITAQEAIFLALDLTVSRRSRSANEALGVAIAAAAAGNQVPQPGVQPVAAVQAVQVNAAHFATRDAAAQTILAQAKVDPAQFAALESLFPNPKKLPLADYYGEITARFADLGIKFDAKMAASRAYYFYEGHLAAPDAAQTTDREWAKQTVDFSVALFKRWENPKAALDAVKNNPALFTRSTKFQNYLSTLLTPEEQDLVRLDALIAAGVEPTGLSGMGETLETVAKTSTLNNVRLLNRLRKAVAALAPPTEEDCGNRLVTN